MLRFAFGFASFLAACTPASRGADAGGGHPLAAGEGSRDPAMESAAPTSDTVPASGCVSDADCGDGICEGQGCGDANGVCVARQRMCTRDAQLYCGCDGVEFRASGRCPGRRFAHRGACESSSAKPDGSACVLGVECASGICEGEGCDRPGTCAPAGRSCTKDLREYCGCDGTTFSASGSCPGQRFAGRSACR